MFEKIEDVEGFEKSLRIWVRNFVSGSRKIATDVEGPMYILRD